ncbi:MAG: hypothetical protein V4568_01755 [Pseudomonadota bacterium]
MNCINNQLRPLPTRKSITVEIDAAKAPAFNELLNEFFNGTRYQAIVEKKRADQETQIASLQHLYNLTQKHSGTGQARVIAHFLACLYNGYRFQFDLTDFRSLDTDIFQHCLNVLWLDNQPAQEVHCYFQNGGELWERMIEEYGLKDRSKINALASSSRNI